jgi:hypothetical protein
MGVTTVTGDTRQDGDPLAQAKRPIDAIDAVSDPLPVA